MDSTNSNYVRKCDEVDMKHYVVPDLQEIANCSFYWGKIGHMGAAKLLEGKPAGTFLLRDSTQENYLFAVTAITRQGCIWNAGIELRNSLYAFDFDDSSHYQSSSVTELLTHYRTNNCIWIEGSMLIFPLQRSFPFDLKHHARAAISSYLTSDSVNKLALPEVLQTYLMEYHNKQRAKVFRELNTFPRFIVYSLDEFVLS